jgi:hypothetical protein
MVRQENGNDPRKDKRVTYVFFPLTEGMPHTRTRAYLDVWVACSS